MNDDSQLKRANLEGKKIFVIEDDRFLHRLLTDKLTQFKAKVFSSYDGNEILEKVSQNKPDIILLDIILPGADGFSILEKLKSHEEHKKIPVIILSNLGQEEDIKKGAQLGAEDFLIKANFTLDEIVGKITKALQGKSA